MKNFIILLFVFVVLTACKTNDNSKKDVSMLAKSTDSFTIAFGSCNNQVLPNTFWNEISKNNPSVWIWGGDIIYTDTEDMMFMEQNYLKQKKDTNYINFIKKVDVLATWDDHDYGLNDGGEEYPKKEASQQLFLDFLDIDKNDIRRTQEGVYFAKDYHFKDKNIKIIILDTRYFRTALTPDNETGKRYKPNEYNEGTMLGEKQWEWLNNQLKNSTANFNIIVSSIQFLSGEHGFECWANMPHEIHKLESMIKNAQAKNTIILSGDRHISEISKKEIEGLPYPLIDFTSSGLTHSYTAYTNEPNKYRISNVVSKKSFGILKFDLKTNSVLMEIRGENNMLYESYKQIYN